MVGHQLYQRNGYTMTFRKHHFELVAIDKSLPGTKLVVLGDENEQYTKQWFD
jgi:hypothetical protein